MSQRRQVNFEVEEFTRAFMCNGCMRILTAAFINMRQERNARQASISRAILLRICSVIKILLL
jgi:hypothetical protein